MSNIIKSSYYVATDDKKLIDVTPIKSVVEKVESIIEQDTAGGSGSDEEVEEIISLKDRILSDAKNLAEEQILLASEQCALLKEEARNEIDEWWQEQRLRDEQVLQEERGKGFAQGYQEGLIEAESAIMEQYREKLDEVIRILEQAHITKLQIIREADPFLIELSCSIAEKVVGQQLQVSPEWVVGLVKKALTRRREQGVITLCVSPAHYSTIMDARQELLLAVDSQAELQILPDSTVQDHGCVIRSAFGSIDARIDTQLREIKKALLEVAGASEGADEDE